MKSFGAPILSILLAVCVIGKSWSQENVHKVKSGETLSQLARQYKTTVDELIRLNPEAAKGLKMGASLRLPASKAGESEKIKVSAGVSSLHKVVSGESLSRIARKYKVSVADLEKWNNISAKDLKAGQELQVSGPSGPSGPDKAENPVREEMLPAAETREHTVSRGETLSSIAQKEGTTVGEIRKVNHLKNDQLKAGQVLRIPGQSREASEKMTPKSEAEKPVTAGRDVVPAKQEPAPAVQKQESLAIPPASQLNEIPVKQEEKPMAGIREVNNTLGYTRVVETGFGEAIEGDGNSKKHLCLHKSAPVGSILQVKNEVNGQSVFVKVIGKLPETGSNEKIIIRISRQAYDRLMASGKRFPVEVSYPEAQP